MKILIVRRATFTGFAGFDCAFNSLRPNTSGRPASELLKAVKDLFAFDFLTVTFVIQLLFPLARLIVRPLEFNYEFMLTSQRVVSTAHSVLEDV